MCLDSEPVLISFHRTADYKVFIAGGVNSVCINGEFARYSSGNHSPQVKFQFKKTTSIIGFICHPSTVLKITKNSLCVPVKVGKVLI